MNESWDAGSALAVIGSRRFPVDLVPFGMDHYLAGVTGIVSGGARGVDQAAEKYAAELGLSVLSYRPQRDDFNRYAVGRYLNDELVEWVSKNGFPLSWISFGEAAKARNWWIVRDGGKGTLAFWDGTSTGTAHGIAAASRFGRKTRIWMEGDS